DAKFALRSALHALPTGDAEDDVVARAHLLLALLSFDELPEDVWQYGPDARLETYLVHKSKQRMVTAAQVAQALFKATTPDAQYGLLLMLGTYNRHELLQSWHPKLTEWCLHEYKANPDSGVHSAIHWLYTRWDMMGALHPLDEHLVNAGYSDGRDWYHDALNHIMVVVRGPRESVQFSQPLMRQYTSEPLARTVRLEHTFAISACEITYRDTASVGFEIERPQELAPSDDCPISTVSFYQAAQLCQLLSALESLPLAFELDDAVAADRKFMFGVRGDIDSAGYRLPTDEEWECVVRGDTTTLRFFGGPETPYLNWYAWYDRDAASTTPVGHHMPNRLGLFDVYGNVFEWTMTTERRGTEPPQPFIDENTLMLLRGSSWPQESVDIHSSIRVGTVAGAARPDVGMRVCRTLNVETFNSD
ncbi:MAG: SUMF1/EgtB/PvdO family nonheme iron enzyme, partial [Planctomycetales bacterium]|nr:SUMF1/EgtB/PvdO family nonheme iron enzyme [Planctomycetales bacterium]